MQTKYSVLTLVVLVFLTACSTMKPQDEAPIKLQQANQLYLQGELTQSEALYRQLIKQSPGLSIAWFQLGNIYVRTHQLEAAVDAFNRAIQVNPNDERYWTNLILTQMKQAESSLMRAKQYHPASPSLSRLSRDLNKQTQDDHDTSY